LFVYAGCYRFVKSVEAYNQTEPTVVSPTLGNC